VHPVPTQLATPGEAASEYEKTLRAFFAGGPPQFDLIFLGMGQEGHTASLFPNSPALVEKNRWVVAVRAPAEPPQRITLTLPLLNQARNVFFLIAGAEKSDVMQRLRSNPEERSPEIPISLVRPAGNSVWFVDEAAYGASQSPATASKSN